MMIILTWLHSTQMAAYWSCIFGTTIHNYVNRFAITHCKEVAHVYQTFCVFRHSLCIQTAVSLHQSSQYTHTLNCRYTFVFKMKKCTASYQQYLLEEKLVYVTRNDYFTSLLSTSDLNTWMDYILPGSAVLPTMYCTRSCIRMYVWLGDVATSQSISVFIKKKENVAISFHTLP